MVMNANELADEIKTMLAGAESYYGNAEAYLIKAEAKLRQLQKERDLLFSAHSHEMVRADQLAVELDEQKQECARLYRIIELNGTVK